MVNNNYLLEIFKALGEKISKQNDEMLYKQYEIDCLKAKVKEYKEKEKNGLISEQE